MNEPKRVLLDPLEIETTAGTQPRAGISQKLVAEYAEDMKNGAVFPPLKVYAEKGSERYILADGFHTRLAHLEIKKDQAIDCELREGTIWDAKLCAAGANAEHGNRRSTKDIRNAVHMLLLDGHSDGWADSVVADYAKCDYRTVKQVREQMIIDGELEDQARRKHLRDGKVVERDVPEKTTGTNKKDKGKDKKSEPPKAPTRSQEDYDREEIIEALNTLDSVICEGSEMLEKYKLHDYIEKAERVAVKLDDLISSAGSDELSDDDAAFLEVG